MMQSRNSGKPNRRISLGSRALGWRILILAFVVFLPTMAPSIAAENLALDSYTCAEFLQDTAQPENGSSLLKSMMMIAWATGYASGVQRDFVRADASAFILIAGSIGDACRKDPARKVPELVATLLQQKSTPQSVVMPNNPATANTQSRQPYSITFLGSFGLSLQSGPNGAGVVVASVDPKGIAVAAGVQTGDVILGVGGNSVNTPADVEKQIAAAKASSLKGIRFLVKSGDQTEFLLLSFPN
jgi:membrane-associated protease RseP (regulator of RpoE activity)